MNGKRDRTPVFLSALVYPGAGQFLQQRWAAGLFYSLSFTVFFLLLIAAVIAPIAGSLDAAFQWAMHQQNRPFQTISMGRVITFFLLCVALYVGNLVDVTRHSRPPTPPPLQPKTPGADDSA